MSTAPFSWLFRESRIDGALGFMDEGGPGRPRPGAAGAAAVVESVCSQCLVVLAGCLVVTGDALPRHPAQTPFAPPVPTLRQNGMVKRAKDLQKIGEERGDARLRDSRNLTSACREIPRVEDLIRCRMLTTFCRSGAASSRRHTSYSSSSFVIASVAGRGVLPTLPA